MVSLNAELALVKRAEKLLLALMANRSKRGVDLASSDVFLPARSYAQNQSSQRMVR